VATFNDKYLRVPEFAAENGVSVATPRHGNDRCKIKSKRKAGRQSRSPPRTNPNSTPV